MQSKPFFTVIWKHQKAARGIPAAYKCLLR